MAVHHRPFRLVFFAVGGASESLGEGQGIFDIVTAAAPLEVRPRSDGFGRHTTAGALQGIACTAVLGDALGEGC